MPVVHTAQPPAAGRARLNLAPRLRPDETVSSWLERFAGAYELTLARFLRWLGYPPRFALPWSRADLDVAPPPDLGEIMRSHAGIAAEAIEMHRLSPAVALPLHLRRTFCPQCWSEEGPYRRREWASAWSLVCTRHRSLLREKPAFDPAVSELDRSWLEFYETPGLWRDPSSCWESAPWLNLCAALGVEPRTEATRAYFWLREIQRLVSHATGQNGPDQQHDGKITRHGANSAIAVCSVGDWRVKRDLVIYAVLKFSGPSLLETLDPGLSSGMLIDTAQHPEICGLATPEAAYNVRLFAAVIAGHMWQRLTGGPWRCRRGDAIEAILSGDKRSSDEDFWLARRLQSWPPTWRRAGRDLFHKPDGWTGVPPWAPCRDYCIRHLPRADRRCLSVLLEEGWQCVWDAPYDHLAGFSRRRAEVATGTLEELWWRRR